MITVEGYLKPVGESHADEPYAVELNVPAPEATVGCMKGSPGVLALLMSHQGETLQLTPTGPLATVDLKDPHALLGALYALTNVTGVSADEDLPDLFGPDVPDAVY